MKTALAIAAHPDDIEFIMSGTLLRLKEAGYEIHYMNVADGCCGSTQHDAGTVARIREAEARDAASHMGAVFHASVCRDLEIFYDRPTLAKVASVVREVAPEILLTHSPSDYMEDHTNACRLAVSAAFTRGMPNFPTDPSRAAVDQQVTLYHAQPHGNRDPLGQVVAPSLFVDVSDLMDRKRELLAKHESQKRWLDESQGLNAYLQAMGDLLHEVGQMSGQFEFAEGWRRHLHLGFCTADADPLVTALGRHVVKTAVGQ